MSSVAGPRPQEPRRPSAAVRDRFVTGLLVAILAVAAVVVALPRAAVLAPESSGDPSSLPSSSAEAAVPVVYREGVVGKPVSVTPVTTRNRADRLLVGLVFSGLVKLGPGETFEPDLASSWTVDDTGKVWTVSIRPDARWQDGEPVLADDVLYTVSALQDPAASGGLSATWADVAVEAVDDLTVRFRLGAPVGGFIAALTQPLLPAHLLADVPMADLAASEFATSPVGSGPYTLVQLDDSGAVLVPTAPAVEPGSSPSASGGNDGAGPDDPGTSSDPGASAPPASSDAASSGAPATPGASGAESASGEPSPVASADPGGEIVDGSAPPDGAGESEAPDPTQAPDPNSKSVDRIEVSFYDTDAAASAAFTAGEIDGVAGLAPGMASSLASGPGVTLVDYPTTTLAAILLNLRTTHPEFRDPDARAGLLGALDRSAIALTALGGAARPADTLVPPESWAFDGEAVVPIPFDRTAAAKAMRKAGWSKTGGKWFAPKAKAAYKLELLTVPAEVNPRLASIADAVKTAWTSFGLSVTVTELTGSELAAKLKSGAFDAALLDISTGLEPDLYPLLDSSQVRANGSNRSGYQNPALDQLLEAARTPGTPEQRQAAWSKLLAELSDTVPVLPIVWASEQMVVRGLSGETPRLIVDTGDRFWDVLAWRLAASR